MSMDDADRMKRVIGEHFSLYGNVMGGIQGKNLIDLDLGKDHGCIWAHVENSGSEGWYVEIARWHEKSSEWRRYAFKKYLGGEFGEMTARECANYVTEVINFVHGENTSIVHGLKNWDGEQE